MHSNAQTRVLAEQQAEEDFDGPSKSRIKRDLQALQAFAEQLVSLPQVELEEIDLSEATRAAIDETARIKDHRALRRHYKRIANCLARENSEPLKSLLIARDARAREASALHHQLERWRARLLAEGDAALTDFLNAHPNADHQQLRTLVRAARRDQEHDRSQAPRKLFRLLRDTVANSAS